ncbi:GntR family transcriptional regulator [Alkalibaculum sp. M08DMB]|uniref:GntR family transcriptional regulator n=1 Tax=Alkalibaculum sporogenes TaxID=2655001 RepID=A0A6A7K9V8_9FIRM|nr:GntR family transcriptional regulator [Alkalibaculum sporogenes]MPW26176.1 GntR family transcriptional regulator [Alkalibaculum sporogenes]
MGVLYVDIVDDIKNKILNGVIQPGDLLQPETEMANSYGVSRTTLRKSFALLVNEGYIYTIPGKGNYVCKPTGKQYELQFDEIENLKCKIDEVSLLDVKVVEPNKKLMTHLMLGPLDRIIRIRKVTYCNKKPIEFIVVYLPYEKGNPIVEDVIKFANFHDIMESNRLHFQIKKKISIEIVKPNDEVRKHLKLNEEYVFLISQQIYSLEKNSILSYNEFYIHGEHITLNAETKI